MIIESTREYNLNPDELSLYYAQEYEEFVKSTDNQDTWDFAVEMLQRIGIEQIVSDLGLEVEGAIDSVF